MPINSFLYPGPTNSNPYVVDNSCRFNDADTASLTLDLSGGAGNRKTWTCSFWFKLGNMDASGVSNQRFLSANTSHSDADYGQIGLGNGDQLEFGTGTQLWRRTNRLFRDPSAWYSVVIAMDTTQGTASNRVKIWVNGTQETSFAVSNDPTEDADYGIMGAVSHAIGKTEVGSQTDDETFDGYLAEFAFLDGTATTASSFGEFDEDSPTIWKPKNLNNISGAKGTNGFYLDFKDSSNLGNDAWGGTDLTESNLAAADQATDTPTNNFCTWNPLDKYYSSATFAEGNTTVVTPNGSITYATGTIGLSSGRWYFEVQPYDPSDDNNIGIVDHVSTSNSSSAGELQYQPRGWCYRQAGDAYNNNSSLTGSWDSYVAGVKIGVFLDLEDNKIYWSRNGVMQNSGTGISITAAASTDTGFYFPAVGDYNGSDDTTFLTNFGGSSSFAISSAVTDDNGYGNFEYTPSVTVDSTAKKFYAICTKNLAEYG